MSESTDTDTDDTPPAPGTAAATTPETERVDADSYDSVEYWVERAGRSEEGPPGDDGLLSWAGEGHALLAGLALGYGVTTPNDYLFLLAAALLGFTAFADAHVKKQRVGVNGPRKPSTTTPDDPARYPPHVDATTDAMGTPSAAAWAVMRAEFSYAIGGFVVGAVIGTVQAAYVGGRAAFGEWLAGLGYAEGVAVGVETVGQTLAVLLALL